MDHLTEEQFELILQGQLSPPEHLQQCQVCSGRLAEKKAVATRLRSAFSDVQASDELALQLKNKLATKVHHSVSMSAIRANIFLHWKYWTATAAAVIMVPLFIMLSVPSQAKAAKAELVKIHNHNLDPDHTFFSESDPQKLANYFKRNLGFNLLMPEIGQGSTLRGCCVKHFRGEVVGSYVVDTPEGIMSIIVVTDSMESLGMDELFEHEGYAFGKTQFAKCDMVGTHIGNYTYCAVGEISHDYLTNLLVNLLVTAKD